MVYRLAVLAMAAGSVAASLWYGVRVAPAVAGGVGVVAFGEVATRVTAAWVAWRNDPWRSWSHRQREIARLAGQELSNTEIGRRLELTPAALTQNLHVIYSTPGTASRQQLVQYMQRHRRARWIPPLRHPGGSPPSKARWEWVAELALCVGVVAVGLTLIPIETIGAARWWAAATLSILGAVGCLLSTYEYLRR